MYLPVPVASVESTANRFNLTTTKIAQGKQAPVFEQAFKNIDDVLWKEAGCTTELDYTEQTSWLAVRSVSGVEPRRRGWADVRVSS
jgi:hypothetical protein